MCPSFSIVDMGAAPSSATSDSICQNLSSEWISALSLPKIICVIRMKN